MLENFVYYDYESFQEENVDVVIPDYMRDLFSPVFCPSKWHQSLNNHWFKWRRCKNSATVRHSPLMLVPGWEQKNASFKKQKSSIFILLLIIALSNFVAHLDSYSIKCFVSNVVYVTETCFILLQTGRKKNSQIS